MHAWSTGGYAETASGPDVVGVSGWEWCGARLKGALFETRTASIFMGAWGHGTFRVDLPITLIWGSRLWSWHWSSTVFTIVLRRRIHGKRSEWSEGTWPHHLHYFEYSEPDPNSDSDLFSLRARGHSSPVSVQSHSDQCA